MSAPAIPLREFDQEMATTRRLLQRVPAEKGRWKPLTVYLRLVDVPIPQIYGPSADEPWA